MNQDAHHNQHHNRRHLTGTSAFASNPNLATTPMIIQMLANRDKSLVLQHFKNALPANSTLKSNQIKSRTD